MIELYDNLTVDSVISTVSFNRDLYSETATSAGVKTLEVSLQVLNLQHDRFNTWKYLSIQERAHLLYGWKFQQCEAEPSDWAKENGLTDSRNRIGSEMDLYNYHKQMDEHDSADRFTTWNRVFEHWAAALAHDLKVLDVDASITIGTDGIHLSINGNVQNILSEAAAGMKERVQMVFEAARGIRELYSNSNNPAFEQPSCFSDFVYPTYANPDDPFNRGDRNELRNSKE